METAHRLSATPGDDERARLLRDAGRGLLAAEVIGFVRLPQSQKRKGTQGLSLKLGFYDCRAMRAVTAAEPDDIAEAIGYSIGGFPWGVEISYALLDDRGGWLGLTHDWPTARPTVHLDPASFRPAGRLVADIGTLRVLGRRLRYRLGVDHNDGAHSLFWWTTPQTEQWIARAAFGDDRRELSALDRRSFNYEVGALFRGATRRALSIDPALNSPDDWGFVDLASDPITVVTIGPNSSRAQTHADVQTTLQRAGDQLRVVTTRVATPELSRDDVLIPYIEALEYWASRDLRHRDCDVILLYRGGFSWDRPLAPAYCARLADAARSLVNRGVEVVLGMGHGTTSIHHRAERLAPVGVFEAITPTAAATWIVREHVSDRLVREVVDPGQP